MKKLFWTLFVLILLGLGFFFVDKQLDGDISQYIVQTIVWNTPTSIDSSTLTGATTFTLDEIGTTFTLPVDWFLSGQINTTPQETLFTLSTPEVDNKSYPMYIRGSLQKSVDSLEQIQQLYNVQLTDNGQTFAIDCDGVSPSKCLGILINSGVYIVALSSQSDQPDEDPNAPTSVYFPNFVYIQETITSILTSAEVVLPVISPIDSSRDSLSK